MIPLGYTDPFSYLSRIAQVAMHSFNENEADAVLKSRLIDASWEAFKVAMDPYVIPAVGPTTLFDTYKELSKAYEEDEEIKMLQDDNAIYEISNKNIEVYRTNSGALLKTIEFPDAPVAAIIFKYLS